jgi:hypothetical protein
MPSVATTFTTFGTAARAGSFGFGETWGNPANAEAADGARASYSNGLMTPWPDGHTFYLTALQLADPVPDGAVVEGVRATVVRRRSAGTLGQWRDGAVHLVTGGTVQTAQNKASAAAYTTSDAGQQYGGPADTWGLALAAEDVNGADFGIAVSCECEGLQLEDADTAEVDAVTVEVFYSLPPTGGGLMLSGCGG